MRLAVIILNYRTPALTVDCLTSAVPQLDPARDCAIVVDNCSGDDSVERISHAARARGWMEVVRIAESDRNGGFAYGNNSGVASTDAEFYLLLNSDTILRDDAIEELLRAAAARPDAGLISPRLEWPNGDPQVSCFRYRSPRSEFVRAAGTRLVTRMVGGGEVGLPISDEPTEPHWTSFAAVLIRREVFEKAGLLDDGFFMYYEDIDFCRRARKAGFNIVNRPAARIVHLRGGTSSAKKDAERRGRLPRYVYESRARYFARYYGRAGLWLTNLLWYVGASISTTRALLARRRTHHCRSEWRDNWIGALARPTRPSARLTQGDFPGSEVALREGGHSEHLSRAQRHSHSGHEVTDAPA